MTTSFCYFSVRIIQRVVPYAKMPFEVSCWVVEASSLTHNEPNIATGMGILAESSALSAIDSRMSKDSPNLVSPRAYLE